MALPWWQHHKHCRAYYYYYYYYYNACMKCIRCKIHLATWPSWTAWVRILFLWSARRDWQADRGIMFSTSPFLRPFVCGLGCLLPNLWTRYFEIDWTDLMPVGISSPQGKGMKSQRWRPGGQRSRSHEAEEKRFWGLAEVSFSTSLDRVTYHTEPLIRHSRHSALYKLLWINE